MGESVENAFVSYDKFLALFEPLAPEYGVPTRLIEKYVGFSVLRDYPKSSAFKPAFTPKGNADTVALIHVLVDPDLPSSDGRTPVRVRVSKYSKYLSTNFDFDFSDECSPTEESVRLSQASIQPVDLMLTGEFAISGNPASILDKLGCRIGGKELLDRVFQRHCNSTRTLSSVQLRIRVRSVEGRLLVLVGRASRFLLTKLLGRQLVPDKELKFLFYGYAPEDVRKISTESVKFFDYLVPKPVAIVFCSLVSAFFLFFHFLGGSSLYLRVISQNGQLAAVHGILALALLNDLLPVLLRKTLNVAIVRGGRLPGFPIEEFM